MISMNKNNLLHIICYSILVFIIIIYPFKKTIFTELYSFYLKNTLTLKNINVLIPKGILYSKGNSSVSLFPMNRDKCCSLFICTDCTNNTFTINNLKDLYKSQGFQIVNASESTFEDYKSTQLYYMEESWRIIKEIRIPEKGIVISYTGNKYCYDQYFKEIIQNINFSRSRGGQ